MTKYTISIKKIISRRARNEAERGVALLFAVLLTSMLLLIGLGIANVAYKELLFSQEARDSDRAFFAADTGVECALFLDKLTVFQPAAAAPPSGVCNGITLASGTSTLTGPVAPDAATYKYIIPIPENGTCAEVAVDKAAPDPSIPPVAGVTYTKISSVGYNVLPSSGAITCTAGPGGSTTNLRLVTRALTTQYQNP